MPSVNETEPRDPNFTNSWHPIAHMLAEPGELVPEPYLTEKDSRFKIGDCCFFRLPLRAREHSPALAELRLLGRILEIHAAYGELCYSVQALEEGLETSLADNPAFELRDSDLAMVSG
jgi:hypothetical protein